MGVDLSGQAPSDPSRPHGILEEMFEAVKGIGDALAEGLNGIVGMIADALFGPGSGEPMVRLSDGMTDLNNRVELLDDVPGYAGAWMSTNRRFGAGSSYKTIPFDRPYGPEKKAYLNTSNHRMILDSGSWSAHFTIWLSQDLGITTIGHGIRATVRDASGQVMINRPFDWGHVPWGHAVHFAMPIIVPPETAPWSIEIGYRHNEAWWHMRGGTDRTLIWVERKNIDTDNSEIETNVPDGPDVT